MLAEVSRGRKSTVEEGAAVSHGDSEQCTVLGRFSVGTCLSANAHNKAIHGARNCTVTPTYLLRYL